MSVLENYLSSKYGKSGVSLAGPGMMTGGGGGSQLGANIMANNATMGLPTMNIPVVATMPMAGMMPIQQGGGGGAAGAGGAVQQGQSQQQQQGGHGASVQTGGANVTNQSGGVGPEPNAQGVKTFSIKL